VVALVLTLALAVPPEPAALAALAVPFLPQTEALCGGAAAAMVFRYWGERHADVQQFAPLVDKRAGGIETTTLAGAVRTRGWVATEIRGSLEAIRTHLQRGTPLILLIEDRPKRYHYVVVVGADESRVVVHDPTWGPSRPMAIDWLMRTWAPTGFWALSITPGAPGALGAPGAPGALTLEPRTSDATETGSDANHGLRVLTACEQLLEEAVAETARRGAGAGDALISNVRARCPNDAGPAAELAALRFTERRWTDAADLAAEAVALDATNQYAWDVLGSSRFMADDSLGALRAWNRIGKPRLDAVTIEGLRRTRYTIVAHATGLTPNTLLSSGAFGRAVRRLEQMPTVQSSRVSLRPDSDGFATTDVAVVEREILPRGRWDWTTAGIRTLVDREARVEVAAPSGQGELWHASWRWWNERPRVALGVAAPRTGWLPGVWRVDGFWEAETYTGGIREERTSGGVSASDWLTANLRYEWHLGLDSWTGGVLPDRRRAVALGGLAHGRAFSDRLRLTGAVRQWIPVDENASFRSVGGRATLRTPADRARTTLLATLAMDDVSGPAPLTVWPGAGGGQARPALLRAHPLLEDNIVAGPAFGKRVASGTLEAQRWFQGLPGRPAVPGVRWGIAAFVDAARTSYRLSDAGSDDAADGDPLQIDAGAGFRLRVPGRDLVLRVDYARGLRDTANAVTVGFEAF
jgi:hypothetical protein